MVIKDFKKLPIMGILRGIRRNQLKPLTESILRSGLKTVEITMNTENAPELISTMTRIAGKELTIGAGTSANPY